MSYGEELSGPRTLQLLWPDALAPVGPYTAFATVAGAPPRTVYYESGAVPFVEVRKVGVNPPIRLYLGDTLHIPSDGALWEARPGFSAFAINIDRTAAPPVSVLVQEPCILRLDHPGNLSKGGLWTYNTIITVAFNDPATFVTQLPSPRCRIWEVYSRTSGTWPGTLTAQIAVYGHQLDDTPAIQWTGFGNVGAVVNGPNLQRRAIVGDITETNPAAWDGLLYGTNLDLVAVRITPGGTAGTDTLVLQVRGTLNPS